MFQSDSVGSKNDNTSSTYCHPPTSRTIESLTNFQTFTTPIESFQPKVHLQLTNSRLNSSQSRSLARNQQHLNKTIVAQYLTGGCSSSSANRSSKSSMNSNYAFRQALHDKWAKRRDSKNVRDPDENNNTNDNFSIRNNSDVEELVRFIEGKPIESNSDLMKVGKNSKQNSSKSKRRRTKHKQQSGDDEKERKSDDSSVVVDDGYVSPDNQYQSQLNEPYNSENCLCSPVRENLVSPHDFIDQSSSSDISQCTRCPGDDYLSNVTDYQCHGFTSSADYSNVLSSSINDLESEEIVVASFSADQSDAQHSASIVYEQAAIVVSKANVLDGKLDNIQTISPSKNAISYGKEYKACQNDVSGNSGRNYPREHRYPQYHPHNVNNLRVSETSHSQQDYRGGYRDMSKNFYPRHRYFNGRQAGVHPSSSSGSFTTLADFLPVDLPRASSLSSSSHVQRTPRAAIPVNSEQNCIDNVPSSPTNNTPLPPYKSMPVESSSITVDNTNALHVNVHKISYARVASDRKNETKTSPSKVDTRQPSTAPESMKIAADGYEKAATEAPLSTPPAVSVQPKSDRALSPLPNRRHTSCSSSSFSGAAVVEFLDNKNDETSDAAARLIASQVSFGFLDEPEWPLESDLKNGNGGDATSSLVIDREKRIEKENKFVQKDDDTTIKMQNKRCVGDKEMLKFLEKTWTKFVTNTDVTYYGQS